MARSMTRMASNIVLQDTVGVHVVPTEGGWHVKTRAIMERMPGKSFSL